MNDYSSRQTLLHVSILLILAGTVLFGNLGGAKLWDRDEPRNAGCAEEMLNRGNLITPIFNDEMRGAKPVLLYWLMMSAYQIFGVNEFSARFWSALLGTGTILLTYFCGRRLFNARAGLLAAIVLLTSLMFVVAGRAATPDSVLVFCVTLAITFFVYGAFDKNGGQANVGSVPAGATPVGGNDFPQSRWFAVLIYGALGLAVLGKGPVGMLLPTAIMGMYLLIVRLPAIDATQNKRGKFTGFLYQVGRTFHPLHFLKTCRAMHPLIAIGTVLVIAAPWYIAVGLKTEGDFITTFFLKEHFGRATMAMENHDGGLFYYPMMMMVGLFPWSVFTLPVALLLCRQIPRNDPWRNGWILAICWIAVWTVAFTVARTKLPSYATPCYPAAALLIGCFLQRWIERPLTLPAWTYRLSLACLAVVGLLVTVAMPILINRYFGGETWLMIVGIILLVGGLIALYFQWNSQHSRTVITVASTAVAFTFISFVLVTSSVSKYHTTPELLAKMESINGEKPALGAYYCMESTWVFYAKVPVHYLIPGAERTGRAQRARDWQPKPEFDIKTFIESESQPYVITTENRLQDVRNDAGVELEVVGRTKYFLNDETLVLLRPVSTGHPAATASASDETIVR